MFAHIDKQISESSSVPTYALLDIDSTLVIIDPNNPLKLGYNQALLSALKTAGILNLILFTNTHDGQVIERETNPYYISRPQLIAHLKKEGFIVEEVVSPCDVSFEVIGLAYEKYFKPIYEDYFGEDNTGTGLFNEEHRKEFDERIAILHDTLSDALKEHRKKALERAKGDEDEAQELQNNKTFMAEFLFRDMFESPSNIVYVDDLDECLSAVAKVVSNPEFSHIRLKTINTFKLDFDMTVLPCKKVERVRREDEYLEVIQEFLRPRFSVDPAFLATLSPGTPVSPGAAPLSKSREQQEIALVQSFLSPEVLGEESDKEEDGFVIVFPNDSNDSTFGGAKRKRDAEEADKDKKVNEVDAQAPSQKKGKSNKGDPFVPLHGSETEDAQVFTGAAHNKPAQLPPTFPSAARLFKQAQPKAPIVDRAETPAPTSDGLTVTL